MTNDLTSFVYDSNNANRFISGMSDQKGINDRFLTKDIYLDDNDVLLASPNFQIEKNFNEVQQLLSSYNAQRKVYHAKMRIYKGDHEAIKKTSFKTDVSNDVTKVMPNLGKNVVNTFVGTFASIPMKVTYNSAEDNQAKVDNINQEIQKIMSFSNSGDVFFEWAKKSDIYGRSYSIAYMSDGQQKFTSLSPENCLVVYDNSLDHKKLFAVTFQNINGNYFGNLYTQKNVYAFAPSSSGQSTDNSTEVSNSTGTNGTNGLGDEQWKGNPNPFGVVPVSELPENDERSGLLDDIAPMMDQLDETLTAQHSDVMYFSNALLIIKGKHLSDKDKQTIRKWHVAELNDDNPERIKDIDMKYLDKPQNDQQQEHHIQHLKDEIYQTSQIINMSDPQLGSSASGDALEKKLQPMVMLAGSKARKMDASIKDLFRILFLKSNNINNEDIENIITNMQIKFTVNVPHNMVDVSNVVKNLNGIVSKNLLISFIPGVEDIQEEIKSEKQEQQQNNSQFKNVHPDNNDPNSSSDDDNNTPGSDGND